MILGKDFSSKQDDFGKNTNLIVIFQISNNQICRFFTGSLST
jgi:hypothetical protein